MLHRLNINSQNTETSMSVLERQRLHQEQVNQINDFLFNNNSSTHNSEMLTNVAMKSERDIENDIFGGVLSEFEMSSHHTIPRIHSFNKRKADKSPDIKAVAEEKKKIKGCEEKEEELRITEQNSSIKSTITADSSNNDRNKKRPCKNNSKGGYLKTDYIHVRARRGQATDSHSLAERVRREKISERMRFLQDLVPGCNKVTGKAGILDEIINYVQSLQKQVEFLSMKLAAVNPTIMDFVVDDSLSEEVFLDPDLLQFNMMSQEIFFDSSSFDDRLPWSDDLQNMHSIDFQSL